MADKHIGEKVLDEIIEKAQFLDVEHAKADVTVENHFLDKFKEKRDASDYDKYSLLAEKMAYYKFIAQGYGNIDAAKKAIDDRQINETRGIIRQLARQMDMSIDQFVDKALKNDPQVAGALNNWKQRYIMDQQKQASIENISYKHERHKKEISDYWADKLNKKDKHKFHIEWDDYGINEAIKYHGDSSTK